VPSAPTTDDLLEGLTLAQREAVTSNSAPICVLASAGAGKTRVLTRRIAYRVGTRSAAATHTMALTFTRKAAGEMQQRLVALGLKERVAAGTFHSLASAQLQRWWADRGQTPPTLLERKGRILTTLAGARPATRATPAFELASHIEWAKARMVSPDAFEEFVIREGRALPGGIRAGDLAALYARYEHEKARRGLVDFDDLLARCAQAIEGDPAFGAAQRWRWRHIYVDEFQDLNPLQHRLLLAWLGSSTDLFVVGDPDQAIYGWNGADPNLLSEVPARWPGTRVIQLDANHRCTEQIVAVAAAVLGPAGARLRSAGREGSPPDIVSYPSEEAEAVGIAAGLRRAHEEGTRWGNMAVLARTNAALLPIQKALSVAGIPCWAPAQAALVEVPVVRRFLSELRHSPARPIRVVMADLEELAGEEAGIDDEARAALTALLDMGRAFAGHDPEGSAAAWIAWLPTITRDASLRSGPKDEVTLCSFHRAKGLEWEAVWIAGLEQGLVPIGSAGSPEEQAEERRLLYVAMTRASERVHCSWARQRTFGIRTMPRSPSPWLRLLESGPAEPAGPLWRESISQQRRSLREASRSDRRRVRPPIPHGWAEPDESLVAAIGAWRLETARASGVPTYAVLHDATVDALASIRPRTAEELLSVPGLGPVKAGRYGAALLSVVAGRSGSAPRHSA
jgi:ATP-dependent DNA helicase UvrD/PcrA